ncbi:MAG: Ig-like domain-containing protein [Bacteroidales bacterium]|jgi:hypothetical protein|nr:Ig-like domain-containing protein [Bacteroidales bacterium]
MKTKIIFQCCILLLIAATWGCKEYPEYDIENPPFIDHSSATLYIDDQIQLTVSPVGDDYHWSSDNDSVATVSQTGLVTARKEGFSIISVTSGKNMATMEVTVREFVALENFILSADSIVTNTDGTYQMSIQLIPENTTENVVWASDDPSVALVTQGGVITGQYGGLTTVTVKGGNITKEIIVNNFGLCDKYGWSVEVSDERASDGGGKDRIIDGSYSDSQYWHSSWSPNVPLPHWAVIDMTESKTVRRVFTQRRSNGDTKDLQYFIGDDPDPDATTWTKITEGAFPSQSAPHTITLDVVEPKSGRYLKLLMQQSYRDPFIGICEIDVYE